MARAASDTLFDLLAELALDLRWSWNHAADEVWRQLDPGLWESTRNAWAVLQGVSRDRIGRVFSQPDFHQLVQTLAHTRRQALDGETWFHANHAASTQLKIAYFSMEFMLSEALPIYSGGLGNVAGDQLKAAGDLGVPVVGLGLLYQRGYFRQEIDAYGKQQALYPYNDPGQLPIAPVHGPNGELLRLQIPLPGQPLWLRAWRARVGRVDLYLLDSNDSANSPAHRGITSELYGGGTELRLRQEVVLGMGGWRLLRALGISAQVCHLNEGHAAFVVLERARAFMAETGRAFPDALAATRAGNLFTTHTAVDAGFDRFPPELVLGHLGAYAENELGLSPRDFLALGREDPGNATELFNMAYLAIRGSGAVAGVSRLHGEVSRRLFAPLFPRWPRDEIPVGHVTNGVHVPTWDSAEADTLWTEACGKERWLGNAQRLGDEIRRIPEATLWRLRCVSRKALVLYAREELSRQLAMTGAAQAVVEGAKHVFNPDALTLGFARRFAGYKRPNLLLRDRERLLRILRNSGRPTQLIIAGKAHPADEEGRGMIAEWVEFIRRADVRPHVIFLGDYDMRLAEHLVQGVDVWINTPRRPWEACGTSGMKILVNGGLNLSELDGWWAEAYSPEVGWALGDGEAHTDTEAWDAIEAEQLYTLLENEVVPAFYDRDSDGLPKNWVKRMRESMARLTPLFSATRAVKDYTDRYYLPAFTAYLDRAADDGAQGAGMVEWRKRLEAHWPQIRFGERWVEGKEGGNGIMLRLELGDLDPADVRVELYAEGKPGTPHTVVEMHRWESSTGAAGDFLYGADVSHDRPPLDYTPRVRPWREGVAVPLEEARIRWFG